MNQQLPQNDTHIDNMRIDNFLLGARQTARIFHRFTKTISGTDGQAAK